MFHGSSHYLQHEMQSFKNSLPWKLISTLKFEMLKCMIICIIHILAPPVAFMKEILLL